MMILIYTILIFVIVRGTSASAIPKLEGTSSELNYGDTCSRELEDFRLEMIRLVFTSKEKYKPRQPILKQRLGALFDAKPGEVTRMCNDTKLLSCEKGGKCGCGSIAVIAAMGEEHARSLTVRENGECRMVDGAPCDFVHWDICKSGTSCMTSYKKKPENCTRNSTASFLKKDAHSENPFEDIFQHVFSGEMCTCQAEESETGFGSWLIWILVFVGVLGIVGFLWNKTRKPQLGVYAN